MFLLQHLALRYVLLLLALSLCQCQNNDIVVSVHGLTPDIAIIELNARLNGRALQEATVLPLQSQFVINLPDGEEGKLDLMLKGLDAKRDTIAIGETSIEFHIGSLAYTRASIELTRLPSCTGDTDCPSGTTCAKLQCQVPLTVGVALVGYNTELEGWTFAHVDGLIKAASDLGYVKLDMHFGVMPETVLPDITEIAQKNQLVLGNSVQYVPDFQRAAMALPKNNFFSTDGRVFMSGTSNFAGYWISRHEAMYIAGMIAAAVAKGRLGIISAAINPQTVLDVNAFTLGARSVKPSIVVEVRHIGYWYDINSYPTYAYTHKNGQSRTYYREEYLAALLIDSGCEVIAHLGNTQRSVRLIELLRGAGMASMSQYSFAFHNQTGWLDGVGQPIHSCIGAIYENWQPLYRDMFEAAHRGILNPQVPYYYDISATSDAPTGVEINPGGVADSFAARTLIQRLAQSTNPPPRQRVFLGPYLVNGQRDINLDGIPDATQSVAGDELISAAETSRMCWYVEGVVEKTDLTNPQSADKQAIVPGGLVPGATLTGSRVPYPANDKLVLPTGQSDQCLENTLYTQLQ